MGIGIMHGSLRHVQAQGARKEVVDTMTNRPLPTASQLAGQTIGLMRAEWDGHLTALQKRRLAGTITEDGFARMVLKLEKRYGEAIDEARAELWAAELSGY